MDERVLVTGGMGFIGLHTARCLLDGGARVVLTYHRTWRQPDFLADEAGDRVHVEGLDLTDGWAVLDVLRRHRIASVVHLAVPGLGTAPGPEYRSVLEGLVNVLEACRQHGVRRVSLASSLAVYSNLERGPWREDAALPVESDTPTAAMKKTMEVLGLHYADRTGLDVRVLRLAAIYGPLYHSMANLPSRLCHAAARGRPVDVAGVRVGTPLREDATDLCYVKDCAAGIRLLHAAGGLRHRVYNVGAGRGTTNEELAAAVTAQAPGLQVSLTPGPPRPGAATAYMDVSRAREEVGYAPLYDIARGVSEYVAWLRTHSE